MFSMKLKLLRGMEYADSWQKRMFDLTLSGVGTPISGVVHWMLRQELDKAGFPEHDVAFTQKRVGRNAGIIAVRKFTTLNPITKKPLSAKTKRIRDLGIDETAQLKQVRNGELSMVGPRPILPDEQEAFEKDIQGTQLWLPYQRYVLPGPYGIANSYGIRYREGMIEEAADPIIRAQLDLRDRIFGSLIYDAKLVVRAAIGGVNGPLVLPDGVLDTLHERITNGELREPAVPQTVPLASGDPRDR